MEFNWSLEDNFLGDDHYTLYISEIFVDPSDPSQNATFKDGDVFLLRYNKPSQKLLKIGVKEIYFNKKPHNYDSLPIISEFMLINASDSASYEEFIAPYNCNISLRLTPFDDEFTSSYKNVVFDLNVSDLEAYAIDGYVDFSHVLFSAPNPNYELTVSQVVIIRETEGLSNFVEFFHSRVWQFTEFETLVSSPDPESDSYQLKLTTTPLFYDDAEQGRWLEYLKIYDENYNYYSAGISGDEYQLLWSPTTHNFTWNPSFNRFQEYWGMEIELPHVIRPNTTLYFEYCSNVSWSNAIDLEYENANFESFELIYNYEYLLTPRFEEWYGELIENSDYDYEIEQFYSENFVVYTETNEYTYSFELEYDFDQDFLNLSLFRIVGLYANFSEKFIDDDSTNYSVNFDVSAKTITITDLISTDGLLNEFDAITVVLNFTHGPVSTKTKLYLSDSFNQSYLTNLENSFYDYLSGSFEYSVNAGDYLLVERAETIASDSTSFTSIDYTRNSELSSNKVLKGYTTSALFDNFELYLDPYNVIYEADSDMDGKRDFKHVIDVDKNGKIDVIRFGVESDVDSNEIVWHTVINDFLGDESLYNLKSRPKETTQWFDVDDAQFATSISGLTILFTDLDYWAKKSVEQTYSTDYSIQSSFYSVMVDEDYDGAADLQYTYEKTDTVQYTRVTNNETTILAAKPQNAITYIYASMAEWIGSLISGGRVDPIFNEKLTPEMIESGSYPSSYHWLASDIRETLTQTYKKYSIITTKLYVDNQLSEQITVNSWDNGTLIETRVYKDLFEDETIDLGIDLSQTITSLETGQQQDVPLDFIPAVQTEEYDKWNDGSNVPSKFESLTIVNSETSSSENINLFERVINIVIPSRINPYDDYKKVVSLKTSSTSDMKLNITGVFITPADGKVYYTSDKESFKRNGGKAAKTNGHYLYYDSDENGFWETVYVLSPVKGEGEGAYYEVMAIGFNYDGKHDFIPYSRTVTGWPIENLNEFKDVLSHEVHLTGGGNKFTFAKLGGCDRLFPEDERDGYELKDNVFEIRKLITKSVQNAKFSELFYETRHKEFNKVWEIFGERYERDLTEQVTISIIAGVAAVLARILTDVVALPVYFAIYTSLSLITNDVKAREAEAKLRSQTFYSEDANNNQPRILSKKYPTDDIWSDSMPAALSGHPGTYYAEVRGGQTGNEYFAYVVAAPPSDARCWGGSNTGFLDFIWSNIDLKWTNTLPQDVNPDIMAGLDFDYHNLDFLMVSSELYSYNDQKHYTYFDDPDLVDKMLELEPIYVVYEPTFFSAPMKYYKTGPQMVLRIIQNYNSYKLRQNTLGYLQHEINERTGGDLNSIKPICSDAAPQYLFAKEDDTAPLSSLFSPLIISSQRYNQLSESRKFGYLFVDIASFGASNTKGIDSTDLLDEEKEFYSAKIPLADLYGAFNYPIESVILHKVVNKEVTSITLDASDYDIPEKLQNLYFARPIDELMGDSASNYDEGTEYYYVCQVKFAKIIPDDGNLSEENQRTLLAQATMYPILDYFDQYVFAATTAKMIGEIAYTEILTWQSTSRSAPIVALAGAAVSIQKILAQGTIEASAQIGSSLLTKVAVQVASMSVKIVAQTIGEVFEEIVVDGFIEAYFENSARMLGWSEGVGQLISTLMTTVRETKMFGLFNLGSQGTNTQGGILQHSVLTTELSQLIAERESSLSFTSEDFLRENGEDVRSIASKLGLVPSRHETILKMAGIIGSGVFAGLSLLIPGLSFAGFSLYGFSPMIKHLGQKITSPKAGTTTMMRAAISNARQDMISKDIKIDNILGIKKGLVQDAELKRKLDSSAAVRSINQISSSGQAVEYLVDSKLVVLTPRILALIEYSSELEKLSNLEKRKQTIEENTNGLEVLKRSEDFLKQRTLISEESDNIIFAFKGEKDNAQMADEVYNWKGRLMPVSAVNLYSQETHIMPTLGNSLQFARTLFRKDGLDLSKPTVGLWIDSDGNRHIIAPGVKFTAVNGKKMIMGEGDAEFTPKLLELLGYGIDVSSAQTWQTDISQQIQLVYVEDLSTEEKLQLPEFYEKLVSVPSNLFSSISDFDDQVDVFKSVIDNPSAYNNPDIQEQIENIFYEFVDPLTTSFKVDFPELATAQGSFDGLKRFVKWYFTLQFEYIYDEINKDVNNKKPISSAQRKAIDNFINVLFREKFETKYQETLKQKLSSQFYVVDLFMESIQHSAMSFIIEEIGGGKEIDPNDLAWQIEDFLSTFDKSSKNELMEKFFKKQMPRIFLKFAESFFTGTFDTTMRLDHTSFQIGYEHETFSFMFIASHFLIKEFIQNNYNLDNLKLFNAFVYNPKGARSLDLIADMKKILNGEYTDLVQKLYNGLDFFDNKDNYRLTDLVSTLISAYKFINFECKNSRDSFSTYLGDVVEDVFSTIFPALFRSVSTGDVNVEGQLEHMITAIDPKDRAAVSGLIRKFTSMHKLENMRASQFAGVDILEGEGARKGPRHIEFYSKVADLINYFLSSSVLGDARSQVASFFKNPLFTEGVRRIAEDVFGYGEADNYVQKAKNFFATTIDATKNLNTLFQKDSQGIYKLVLDITFNVYKRTDIEITETNYKELFENIKFFVVDGKIKSLLELSKDDIKGSWAVVHRELQGTFENGLILVNRPQLDLLDGLHEGFKVFGSDAPIEGVFINQYDSKTDKSYLLVGPVRLNPTTKILEQVSDDEIAWLLDSSIVEESVRLVGASKIDKYYAFEYFRSACQKVGSQLTFVLQDVKSRIIPTGAHKKIVSGITAIKSFRFINGLKPQKVVINLERYNVPGMNKRISALCNILDQLGGKFTITQVYKSIDMNPKIFLDMGFYNLFSDKDKYTMPYFKNMLERIKPTSSDPLFNPQDPLFSNNWYRFIARFSLDDAGNTLFNGLTKETFYKNWLTVIKNDLKRNGPSGYFEEFSMLSGFDFHGNFKDEINHQLIKLIDAALIDALGYPVYLCLLTGILSITEIENTIGIDFLLHPWVYQGELIHNWGLRPLSFRAFCTFNPVILARTIFIDGIRYHHSALYFASFLISGFSHFITKDKSIDFKHTSNQFINNYFSSYDPVSILDYLKASKIFLAKEFSYYMSTEYVDKMNLRGREKIEEFLYKRISIAVKNIFERDELVEKYNQFDSDRESWEIRTEKIAQSFVRICVDNPSTLYDFTLQLRNILHSGKDGYITLKVSSKGGKIHGFVRPSAYGGNALLNDGLTIFIPHNEALKYIEDIRYTLKFNSRVMEGYRLLFEQFSADVKLKFLDMYNKFYNLFSIGPSDQYKIIFATEKGKGIDSRATFPITYKNLGFKKDSIIFKRDNAKDFQEAVASMVFYLFSIPNAFIDIKAGDYNYFYADIFGLYDHEYVRSSDYKTRIGGEFIWTESSGIYTPEAYEIWKQKFEGIFTPTDIRYFLMFENDAGISTLDYMMKLFNEWFKMNRNTIGIPLSKFAKIEDLRL